MQIGEAWRAGAVQSLMASPQWAHMAVFLDVYKRQVHASLSMPPPPADGRFGSSAFDPNANTPTPVSYTHLDVYKRQSDRLVR